MIDQPKQPLTAGSRQQTYTAHLICGCGATNVVDTATYPVGTTMRARCRVCGSESEMRIRMVEIK